MGQCLQTPPAAITCLLLHAAFPNSAEEPGTRGWACCKTRATDGSTREAQAELCGGSIFKHDPRISGVSTLRINPPGLPAAFTARVRTKAFPLKPYPGWVQAEGWLGRKAFRRYRKAGWGQKPGREHKPPVTKRLSHASTGWMRN